MPAGISLGVLAALLTFIPNIGPLAALPQMLLAVNVGTQTVLYVLLFNVNLQTVESYLITPLVQRHELSLPPILTIAAARHGRFGWNDRRNDGSTVGGRGNGAGIDVVRPGPIGG